MVNRVISKLNTINTKLDALLMPAIVGRFIDRHWMTVTLSMVLVLMVLAFLIGQMFTTPIHHNASSFHQAYSEWFNAGGCR